MTVRGSDSLAMVAAATPDRPFVPGAPGRALAGVYSGVVRRRNRAWDTGRGVVTFDRPVVSVGNLSLGGTGKTPMVARVLSLLREHGHDPCVAMRGYGAGRKTGGLSDEAESYRAEFDDLPVVAQPDRAEGLIRLFASERGARVDCVVLDDGFQHRRIARQLDLVLIDATHDLFGSGVFPAGRLREPVESLRRATHVTITHAELVRDADIARLREKIGAVAPDAAISVAAHAWSGLAVVEVSGARENEPGSFARQTVVSEEPVSWLAGKRVVVACGIGRPQSFLAAVERAGARAVGTFVLPDHHPFGAGTVRKILGAARQGGAEAIVVTEKDWTKLGCRAGVPWPCPVVRPRLELEVISGWDGLAGDILAVAGSSPD